MVRVLVVDDHPVVREGLSGALASEPDFKVVSEAATAEQALRAAEEMRPDVVVLDVRLPRMSGAEACTNLLRRVPGIGVIALTSFPNEGVLSSMLSAGAQGFVLKESDLFVLRQAVREVASGESFVDPKVSKKLMALAAKNQQAKGPFGLTLHQMRVLELLPRGLSNREIALKLGVSENTVKSHLRRAMKKLKAKDRVAAAAIALKEGLA